NRVIVRRGGDLDGAARRGLLVRGQDRSHDFALLGQHQALVMLVVIASLSDQQGNLRIVEEKLVKPGELRQHLKICKILRLKELDGMRGVAAGAPEALKQFVIARVTSYQVNRI